MLTLARRLVVACSLVLISAIEPQALALSAQVPSGEPDSSLVGVLADQLYAGILSYTAMRTVNTNLALSTTAADAFTATALPCPASAGAAGCTVRVTVTSQFLNIAATEHAQMIINFTGPGTLGPANLIAVAAAGSVVSPVATHSMQWVKKNVPAGSTPTITIQFQTTAGAANAGFRTLSIEVFNGLL